MKLSDFLNLLSNVNVTVHLLEYRENDPKEVYCNTAFNARKSAYADREVVRFSNEWYGLYICLANEFDLPSHLLGNIYPQMDEAEKAQWDARAAMDLCCGLNADGIACDPEEVFQIIADFIRQDKP